jgi:formylmethanofuran dehydrogenase subunit B
MPGIECDRTAYRTDDVPLKLKKVVESKSQPDRLILEGIISKIKADM